jgi:phage shock protein C
MVKHVRRLFRSRKNRVFVGVCGGIGEYFSVDPVIVRLIWILLTFLVWIIPGILCYLLFWLVIPEK